MRALLALLVAAALISLAPNAPASDASNPAPNGHGCSGRAECASGYCADGVCCNVACNGVCEACVAEKKQSRQGTGTCGPVRGGTDPDDECTPTTPESCGKTGQCAGAAAQCAFFPLGTPCDAVNPTQCQNGSFLGRVCTGQGACSTNPYTSPTSCGDYVCRRDVDSGTGTCSTPCPGHCAAPCASNSDCSDTQKLCLGGACVPKLDPGATCAGDGECRSGHCVDGVCCNATCPGACQACNLPGTEGTCTPVTGTPPATHGGCAGTGACKGTCAGQPECFFPGTDTKCGAATCTADSFVDAPGCDGVGECTAPASHDCGDFTCDSKTIACKTNCITSADCKGGAVCLTAEHRCTAAGAVCDGNYSVKATDGTVSSCNGYRCVVSKCQQQCGTDLDCAPGYGCAASRCALRTDGGTKPVSSGGASGNKVDASAPASGTDGGGTRSSSNHDAGGCGCEVGREGSSQGALALLVMAGIVARRIGRAKGVVPERGRRSTLGPHTLQTHAAWTRREKRISSVGDKHRHEHTDSPMDDDADARCRGERGNGRL